jgi:hypothetical protein
LAIVPFTLIFIMSSHFNQPLIKKAIYMIIPISDIMPILSLDLLILLVSFAS